MKQFLVLLVLFSSVAFAKRSEPATIRSIVQGDRIINFRVERADCQVAKVCAMQVFLTAKSTTSGRIIWERELYEKALDPKLEYDVQMVLPKSLRLEGKKFVATDEKGSSYKVDLEGKLLSPPKSIVYPLSK